MVKKETSRKPPAKPFTGKEGVQFSKDHQPPAENKKEGWQQWREKRLVTQSIIKRMVGKDGNPTPAHTNFIDVLFKLTTEGNAKAIDVIMKCMEDDIQKVAQVDTFGNNVSPALNITCVTSIPISEIE